MHPMSAEPEQADRPTPTAFRGSPVGVAQDLQGVSRAMELLMSAIDELAVQVPSLESRLSPVLVDGGPTGSRLSEGTTPLRCGLAESIEMRTAQVRDVSDALRALFDRIDL